LHRWEVSPEEARAIQKELRGRVQKTNGFEPDEIKTVAGVDCSLKDEGQAAIVVLSFPGLEVVERVVATRKLDFPYIPGLLSFREIPLILDTVDRLKEMPDLFMVDGQGYAHPRRFGIACHLGVYLDRPSLGCAKSILWGRYDKEELGLEAGDQLPVIDYRSSTKEIIGIALRSKRRTNPLIISIGHKIDLPTAVEYVQKCLRGYRLPETTRAAHNLAGTAGAFPVSGPDPLTGQNLEQGKLF
jgi:deoxyribonuclease V